MVIKKKKLIINLFFFKFKFKDLEEQDWEKDLQEDIDNITAEELEKEISQMIGNDEISSK